MIKRKVFGDLRPEEVGVQVRVADRLGPRTGAGVLQLTSGDAATRPRLLFEGSAVSLLRKRNFESVYGGICQGILSFQRSTETFHKPGAIPRG